MGTYVVKHITYDATPVVTDISNYIHSIDYVNLYSDGRISTASITLQSSFGNFITNTNGGATPIIDNFDRIQLEGIDSLGRSYVHIFEVINDLSQVSRQSEYLLPLTLEGRERALAAIPFSGYFDALNHFEMVEKILQTYTISKLNDQVNIATEDDAAANTNALPEYNPNIWDFQYIDNCLDAILAVVRLANQSVAAGGGGDRFGVIYEDSTANPYTFMSLRILSQGNNNPSPATPPVIRSNEIYNPISIIKKTKQPITGTTVIARGKPGSGGVPVAGDIYRSRLEFYQRIQARQSWDATIFYKEDSYTSFNGQVYQAISDNTGSQPPSGNWSAKSAADYIGTLSYSFFTKDKAALFRNECTHPDTAFASESENSPKMLDCNIVINDAETQRDWVNIRQVTDIVGSWSAFDKKYAWEGTTLYDGFRILVDTSLGTAAGSFSASSDVYGTGNGKDPNGLPFANNAAVLIDSKWYVIKEHEDFDQIVVRAEGLFEWNVGFASKSQYPANDDDNTNRRYRQSGSGTPDGWRELGEQFLANDCLHSPSSITNITGLIDPVAQPVSGNYTDDSAVRIIYEYSNKSDMPEWRKTLEQIAGYLVAATGFIGTLAIGAAASLYDMFLTPYWRNAGWWITLTAPFPVSTHNGIGEKVGELYGGGDSAGFGELSNHAVFDAYNQTSTFTGKRGWAENDSTDMMEITGVTFLFRLDIQADGVTMPFTGDISCSMWAIDDNGTIWKSKKTYRHLNDVQRMTFDYGDFSPVYRARTPFGINTIVTNILVPELEIRERLFANRIRIQGFQLEGSYDEHGRYLPNLWESVIKPTIFTMFDPTTITTNVKFIGDIDYIQWVKTPIAISSAAGATRVLFPEIKDYPNISNVEQLQRAADADVDIEQFQYEQYVITRNDKADIQLQDSVYLYEKYMIKEAEAPLLTAPAWSGATNYEIDDFVLSGGNTYICIEPNINNVPPNVTYWVLQTDPLANTRLLTVGEINWSVTNGKDVEFVHTLIRRIPKV